MRQVNGLLKGSAPKKTDVTVTTVSDDNRQRWKPITLRRPFLTVVVLITLVLLASIQVLVLKDGTNQGILFAPRISDLPPFQIFLYRYLPTIISVSYGLVWHWIDLDTRRIEPYRQLSKPGGASGLDSLLLHYPTDLLALVPLKALKRRHWPVVVSSFALVLVGMGLTPLQAAMFATETVTRTFDEPMLLSTKHLSLEEQATQVTANYTYSVSNILWLNERLPKFMTREAAFAPFEPVNLAIAHAEEYWTANTTSFGVDVTCEEAVLNRTAKMWVTSQGCRLPDPLFGPDGTDIIGQETDPYVSESTSLLDIPGQKWVKDFTPFYAGYYNKDGLADYYLSPYCPEEASKVFMVAFARNRRSREDPPGAVTRLFCESAYYQQPVTAQVQRADGQLMKVLETSPKSPLPDGMFNISLHEWQMNSAMQQNTVRGAIPSTKWPDQGPELSKLPISLRSEYIKMSHMIGLAIGAYPMSTERYMEPDVLAKSYQALYRLLFARAMVDVLTDDFEGAGNVNGTRHYQSQAVRIVPRFAYAVESILGVVALMVAILLVLYWGDATNLLTDPDSMSALMMLVKGQYGLLGYFSPHDRSSWKHLTAETCDSTYVLELSQPDQECALKLKDSYSPVHEEADSLGALQKPTTEYPIEFSLAVGLPFVVALLAVLAAVAYFHQTAQAFGLSLPSNDQFIRQMLENYIPTIIATLIEPLWVVLNRLLCLLQPFEELRSADASPSRSIRLNYSSTPPQFTVFKALRARHFILSAVCMMALLANALAVAFGGMFNEEILSVPRSATATPLFEARFKSDIENATKSSSNPFYLAMANFTSQTPLPPWTDEQAFYIPHSLPTGLNTSNSLQINEVVGFSADLDCRPIGHGHQDYWDLRTGSFYRDQVPFANLTVTLGGADGTHECYPGSLMMTGTSNFPFPCTQQTMGLEIITPLSSKDPTIDINDDRCQGLIAGLWFRKPANTICGNDSVVYTDDDAMALVCRPNVVSRLANLTVTGGGLVHEAHHATDPGKPIGSSAQRNLTREASGALFQPISGVDSFVFHGGNLHNDSFPSDWNSYVMNILAPDSGMLDPTRPIPEYNETAALLAKVYAKMFAIYLGMNYNLLLEPTGADEPAVASTLMQPEIRITVSRAMMILSSTILAMYIVVAVAVYVRRPEKYLPRMPLTMGSDIAMFAASTIMAELEDDGHSSTQKPTACFEDGTVKVGYGTFVGSDGKLHVGIERQPFVVPL